MRKKDNFHHANVHVCDGFATQVWLNNAHRWQHWLQPCRGFAVKSMGMSSDFNDTLWGRSSCCQSRHTKLKEVSPHRKKDDTDCFRTDLRHWCHNLTTKWCRSNLKQQWTVCFAWTQAWRGMAQQQTKFVSCKCKQTKDMKWIKNLTMMENACVVQTMISHMRGNTIHHHVNVFKEITARKVSSSTCGFKHSFHLDARIEMQSSSWKQSQWSS